MIGPSRHTGNGRPQFRSVFATTSSNHQSQCNEHRLGIGWVTCTTNSMFHTGIEIDDERQIIATAIDTIGAHTVHQHTKELSSAPALPKPTTHSISWQKQASNHVADWVNDDQPYRMNVKSGRMFAIPYSLEINDLTAFMFQGRSAVWANDQGPIRRPLSRKRDDFAGHVDLRPPLVDWAPLSQQIFRRGARLYQRSRRRVVRTRSGNRFATNTEDAD